MRGWRETLVGRWGFVLTCLAVLLFGGMYFIRMELRNNGLRVFHAYGEKVYLVTPWESDDLRRDMLATAWVNSNRHPSITDIRFALHIRPESVRDQFGRPAETPIYLGSVHLLPRETHRLREARDLAAAGQVLHTFYLDWEWEYRHGINYLARDDRAAQSYPRNLQYAVGVDWVLLNMMPKSRFPERQMVSLGADGDWRARARSASATLYHDPERRILGVTPEGGRAEVVLGFAWTRPMRRIMIRDMHNAWDDGESVELDVSVDGRQWTTVYKEEGQNRLNLFAKELVLPASSETLVRYRFRIAGGERAAGDPRGASLSFLEVGAAP